MVQELMAAYQALDEYGGLVATLQSDRATVDEDCRDVLDNIFKGAWYFPNKLQLVLLMNAFQASDKQLFPQSDAGLKMVFDVVSTVHGAYGLVSRQLHFCLEVRKDD